MGLKHKVNKLLLDIIRVNKVLELFIIVALTIVLWAETAVFLKEFTTFYKAYYYFWAIYGVCLVFPTILHINYNNVFYNLRLTYMARDYNAGMLFFRGLNKLLCGMCFARLCRDRCLRVTCILKWILLASFTVVPLFAITILT